MPQTEHGALSHLRILDLSRVLAGPWATQLLADLGAEVIKIERPGVGDDTRSWGPPYLRDRAGRETRESAYFLGANRGKKSVAVDITQAEGRTLIRRLAEHSDVLIENFKVGGLRRHGLGYDELRAVNPRLIYCSITGFGQTGPAAGIGGYDFVIQALGGLMSVTGERDAAPGGGPQKVGVAIADLMTGMYAGVAILAALEQRHRSGLGQHIDLALLDVQVAALANQAMNYLISGQPPTRSGNAHPNIVPYQVFACRDGHLVIAVGNDQQFQRLCEVLDCPELADDPRFATNSARVRHRDALIPILEPILHQRNNRAWGEVLTRAGVPCGPINSLDEVFADPQVRHRGMRIELPHALSGAVPLVANPIRFSGTPVQYRAPPPQLGEHTGQVLRDLLGVPAEELNRLAQAGIIAKA